jgi:hypothetical protein
MTAALLAVRIKVTNFYGLAATFLPLNWHIDVVHIFISLPNVLITGRKSAWHEFSETNNLCAAQHAQ